MYLRVSTDGQSLETQNDSVVRAARARGDRIGRFYAEIEGGDARRRPELQRLLADAREGLISRLYVYRLDRLTRGGASETLNLIHELERAGVELVTLADGFDVAGPARDVILAVLGWQAERELLAIRERLATAKARVTAAGGQWGRPRRVVDAIDVFRLKDQGRSIRQISMALKCPKSTVHRVLGRNVATPSSRVPPMKGTPNLSECRPKNPMIASPSKGPKKCEKKG
jgi:DNA invertase Pin-like site-specific DNA recombinase